MKNQKQTIKCSECEYCSGLRPVRNTRTEFTCTHPLKEMEYGEETENHGK